MRRVETGDCVLVDIPDAPGLNRFHGGCGEVVKMLENDADSETGDERDAHLFTVEFVEAMTRLKQHYHPTLIEEVGSE